MKPFQRKKGGYALIYSHAVYVSTFLCICVRCGIICGRIYGIHTMWGGINAMIAAIVVCAQFIVAGVVLVAPPHLWLLPADTRIYSSEMSHHQQAKLPRPPCPSVHIPYTPIHLNSDISPSSPLSTILVISPCHLSPPSPTPALPLVLCMCTAQHIAFICFAPRHSDNYP